MAGTQGEGVPVTAGTQHFRAVWPVIDHRPLHSLIAEARLDLPNVAARHRVHVVGVPFWTLQDGRRVPGLGGWPVVLVADCQAVAVVDRDAEASAWAVA